MSWPAFLVGYAMMAGFTAGALAETGKYDAAQVWAGSVLWPITLFAKLITLIE